MQNTAETDAAPESLTRSRQLSVSPLSKLPGRLQSEFRRRRRRRSTGSPKRHQNHARGSLRRTSIMDCFHRGVDCKMSIYEVGRITALWWKHLMGLIYAGLISLPSFSPFWLDEMHMGEGKKNPCLKQSSKRRRRWRIYNFQFLIWFVHQLPLGPFRSEGFTVAGRPSAV